MWRIIPIFCVYFLFIVHGSFIGHVFVLFMLPYNTILLFDASANEMELFKGVHSNIIVPPSWIVKLPRKGSFKSSLRKTPRKKEVRIKQRTKEKESKAFIIKAVPTTKITPVLVFINPKSGGNQVNCSSFYASAFICCEMVTCNPVVFVTINFFSLFIWLLG